MTILDVSYGNLESLDMTHTSVLSECIFRLLSSNDSFVVDSGAFINFFVGLEILTVWLSSVIEHLDKTKIEEL